MVRALVVDGYDETRDALLTELRRRGFNADGAADEDGVPRGTFDVVIMDAPAAELEEIACSLRARFPSAVVIALIDRNDVTTRARGRAAGVDAFLLRPCPPHAIVRRAIVLLDSRRP